MESFSVYRTKSGILQISFYKIWYLQGTFFTILRNVYILTFIGEIW